jgi:hypothetical protein
MKKILLSIFTVSILGSGISQAVSDRNTIPVAVNLNRVLRMSVNTGGNIEFTFNTIAQYKNGISGDLATSGSAGTAAANPMYVTSFTIAASTKWRLDYGAEDATFIGVDNPGNTAFTLDNVGFSLGETGAHAFGTELASTPTNAGVEVAALQAYPVVLITDGANPAAANAGDATDNAFTMTWRCGTAEAALGTTPMNQVKLIEQGITPDRFVTNVLFNLIAL